MRLTRRVDVERVAVEFEDYVTDQGQSLLRLAYVLTGDGDRAEDLAQTALADAYRHWRKVDAARQPDAYVRRMLVNAHLDWHRRRSSTEQPTDLAGWEPRAVNADPADEVVSRDQLRAALSTLAPRSRTALVLRYYADLDDNGIASAMGVSASAVRATISRALTALRSGGVIDALKETP
jgi:RNA polymerase sigma-70 factor (sigma-E family)